jgi:diguanylate cyclase (GGDEF)-like protein
MSSNNGQSRKVAEVKTVSRSHEIQEHMGALAGRDVQLLSISLLLLLVLSGGILALVAPNLLATSKTVHADARFLPQLFFGLTTLIILFNAYILLQKKELSTTRRRLVEELIFNERMEAVSLIDPVTQLFNRRAMEQMVAHEVARTNRLGSALSVLVLDISDFEAISDRCGTQESEQFLYGAAQLVKNTFRGSDMVFRSKEAQFLVVMPGTSELQVDFALKRLDADVIRHNSEPSCNAELSFCTGVAEFVQGSRITDTLLNAERKAFLRKHSFATVF